MEIHIFVKNLRLMAKNKEETNPFIYALEIEARWILIQGGKTKSEEPASSKQRYEVALIDVENRCSVYTDVLLGWFKDLSTSAKDMVLWIAMKLPTTQDYLQIVEEDYSKEMECSRATFFASKTQITNKLIIPRTCRKNTYWVNPAYLYKGDRIDAFREKVVPNNDHPIHKNRQGKSTENQ